MALYYYQALSKGGKKVTGYFDASSVQGVKDHLSSQGMYPVKILPAKEEVRKGFFARLFARGVTEKDKILFTKQLAILLKSGVPLLQAIELLTDHFEGGMRAMLVGIKDDIREGRSFADALKKYPKTFNNIYVQLVRAGEASGKLETILDRLTEFLERQAEIKKRVTSALRYPLIQLGVAVAVVAFLLIQVVPQMVQQFAEQGKELPPQTAFLLSISNLFTEHYLVIIIALVAIVAGYNAWRATPSGARKIDQLKLRLPLIKRFTRMNAVVQFSYTLGLLIESGVNLAEALDIVCNIIDNRVLADALNAARDKIIKQGRIAQYLKQTNIFPPIAIYLIQTGEQSGQLDTMLLTVAHNYEEDLKELADSLSAALGPILLIVMAVVVGFIVMAIITPIMQMGEVAGV